MKMMRSGLLLALGLMVAGVWPAAAQSYEELCELSADCIERDSLDQAQAYILQALKLEPANLHNALLFSNLGTLQRRQGKYQEALESYTYALNVAPRSVPILLNRAAVYLEVGKNELSQTDCSLVLDFEPDNEEALLMRAYIYLRQRDNKLARADYERLVKAHPTSYNGRLGLATLEQKEHRYEQALNILNGMIAEKVEDAAPSYYATLYTARADVEKDMGHADMALIDLDEAIKLDETLTEAYLIRGELYISQKRKELAKHDFEKAIALGVPASELQGWLRMCR